MFIYADFVDCTECIHSRGILLVINIHKLSENHTFSTTFFDRYLLAVRKCNSVYLIYVFNSFKFLFFYDCHKVMILYTHTHTHTHTQSHTHAHTSYICVWGLCVSLSMSVHYFST